MNDKKELPKSKEYQNVFEFHQKFNLMRAVTPRYLTREKLEERIDFLQEELDEFKRGAEAVDMPEMADALVDLVYVALGTAIMMGLPWDELWDDVQRANMDKVAGVTKRGHAVDVMKPPGWLGPLTVLVLHENNWIDREKMQPIYYHDGNSPERYPSYQEASDESNA